MVEGKENGEEFILENLPQSTFFGMEIAEDASVSNHEGHEVSLRISDCGMRIESRWN
jgi:hypothetical protein